MARIEDIGEWLEGLGLGQYEAVFRNHNIDVDTLSELTDEDLSKLGVALGARRRILRAAGSGTPGRSAPVQAAAVERRNITVLSCRFEASPLPAQFDVEDWRDLYGGCVDEGLAIATRFGGRGQPELGDSLMATFGYPQAHEDDAERAVRAALAIQLAVEKRNARSPPAEPRLNARIGIECGEVVIDS